MRSFQAFALAVLASSALIPSLAAHAATISAGVATPVGNGGTAPGSGQNYDFGDFGSNGQPIVLNDFTVSTAGDNQYPGNGNYTTLIAPGGTNAFYTGIAYAGSGNVLLATFSPDAAGSFSVWILDANTDGNGVGNITVGLGVNGGTEVSTATVYDGLNEFTRYDVSGALPTDVFDVYADSNTSHASVGGLTFGAYEGVSPVPEPSSLSMGLLGLLAGIPVARRRFRM